MFTDGLMKRKSLRVMVDYADYGSLTTHDDFLEYVKEVWRLGAKPNVDIRIVLCGECHLRQQAAQFFNSQNVIC
jgi:hypothetical protein